MYVTFPQTGSFEVVFMNKKIFSKLTLGIWPNSQKIVAKIQDILSGIEIKDYSFVSKEEKSKLLEETSFYMSRSKSRSRSRGPQNNSKSLNKSLEKSGYTNEKSRISKEKPQTAQKEKRGFPAIHENIGKYPPYFVDAVLREKTLQKKFINESFVKNNERKFSKIPLKINNYGLIEIQKEMVEKKPESNERKNSEFFRKTEKRPSEAKIDKSTPKSLENVESIRKISGNSNKTGGKKDEIEGPGFKNDEKKSKAENILFQRSKTQEKVVEKVAEEQQVPKEKESHPISPKHKDSIPNSTSQISEKKQEETGKIEEKSNSAKNMNENPNNDKSISVQTLSHIPESNPKTKSFNQISPSNEPENLPEKPSTNHLSQSRLVADDPMSQPPLKEKISDSRPLEKSEKSIEKENPQKPISESYVVNYFEQDYENEEFDKDSERDRKQQSNKTEKPLESDDLPPKNRTSEKSSKKQLKRDPSRDVLRIEEKPQPSRDLSQENLEEPPKEKELERKKPKKKKKKKEDSSEILEREPQLLEDNSLSFLQSPKKTTYRNPISDMNSPLSASMSPKKLMYEYSVDFEKSSMNSPERKGLASASILSKSLNKSKELSPVGDFAARESSLNKNGSKLQPLREIGKSTDLSQEMHKKQAKLMPIKQSPTLERPITQEGNQRKKPLLAEIPKKLEAATYESEKFCTLKIPIKKSVKKKITVNNDDENTVNITAVSSDPSRLEIVNPENVIEGMGSLKVSLLFREYPVLDQVLYKVFMSKDGRPWQKIMLTANYVNE